MLCLEIIFLDIFLCKICEFLKMWWIPTFFSNSVEHNSDSTLPFSSLSTYFCSRFGMLPMYYWGFWGQNQMLLQVSVLIRQSSTSTLGTLSDPNNCYWKSNLSTEESSYEISHIRLPAFPWLFLFCSSLHFRKRIQVFCLLCVSVWPLRGPWCQLRWSAQCICGNKTQHVIRMQMNPSHWQVVEIAMRTGSVRYMLQRHNFF